MEAVARLCQDDAARKAMRDKAKEFAMLHFTVDKAVFATTTSCNRFSLGTTARPFRRQAIRTTTSNHAAVIVEGRRQD